jgi:DNA-binding PadR family transcriptional regulator
MNSTGVLILTSLADGDKHGYALTKDVAAFAGVKLAPGTLYEALQRLERQGLIEPLEPVERRRPYRLTAAGASALQAQLDDQLRATETGLRRLAAFG